MLSLKWFKLHQFCTIMLRFVVPPQHLRCFGSLTTTTNDLLQTWPKRKQLFVFLLRSFGWRRRRKKLMCFISNRELKWISRVKVSEIIKELKMWHNKPYKPLQTHQLCSNRCKCLEMLVNIFLSSKCCLLSQHLQETVPTCWLTIFGQYVSTVCARL